VKKSNKIDIFAIAGDNSIEAFFHKKLKIGGVIWHPERFKKFRNRDIKIIKKFYATGNFSFRKR
jgi:gamma-glutamyl-gamma-aminobutyrate hydrolase PuuD